MATRIPRHSMYEEDCEVLVFDKTTVADGPCATETVVSMDVEHSLQRVAKVLSLTWERMDQILARLDKLDARLAKVEQQSAEISHPTLKKQRHTTDTDGNL